MPPNDKPRVDQQAAREGRPPVNPEDVTKPGEMPAAVRHAPAEPTESAAVAQPEPTAAPERQESAQQRREARLDAALARGDMPSETTVRDADALPSNPTKCPHCGATLIEHTDASPHKREARHCNSCGCCFQGGELRPGHSACSIAALGQRRE